MKEIILSWNNKSSFESKTIRPDQPSKKPGKVRIGRDPSECDIVLPSASQEDLTVSKLHVEIYFDGRSDRFYLRNLKGEKNPPKVYGHTIHEEPAALNKDGIIYLGKRELKVTIKEIRELPKPLICPRCKTGYTYEEGAKMAGRCLKDGFPLHGDSIYIPVES